LELPGKLSEKIFNLSYVSGESSAVISLLAQKMGCEFSCFVDHSKFRGFEDNAVDEVSLQVEEEALWLRGLLSDRPWLRRTPPSSMKTISKILMLSGISFCVFQQAH